MELKETVDLMNSSDYKERFKAEYLQLEIRTKKLKEFLHSLKTVKKVDILPYHDLGKFKWTNLGLQYPLEGVRTANNEDVLRAKTILGLTQFILIL